MSKSRKLKPAATSGAPSYNRSGAAANHRTISGKPIENDQDQLESAPYSTGIVTRPAPRYFGFVAIALAVIFFFVTLSESLVKGPTSDEPPHLASGRSHFANS